MGKKAGRRATGEHDTRKGAGQPGRCLGEVAGNADLRMRADTRLSTAWAVFLDRDLQTITVVDENGRPVGTLLRRDLADSVLDDAPTIPGALLEELTPPVEAIGLGLGARGAWPRGWRNDEALVEDVMRASVNTLPS